MKMITCIIPMVLRMRFCQYCNLLLRSFIAKYANISFPLQSLLVQRGDVVSQIVDELATDRRLGEVGQAFPISGVAA